MARYLFPFTGTAVSNRGDPFFELHREMNRLFDDASRGLAGGRDTTGIVEWMSATDRRRRVSETRFRDRPRSRADRWLDPSPRLTRSGAPAYEVRINSSRRGAFADLRGSR